MARILVGRIIEKSPLSLALSRSSRRYEVFFIVKLRIDKKRDFHRKNSEKAELGLDIFWKFGRKFKLNRWLKLC